jgi:hypothetical protein
MAAHCLISFRNERVAPDEQDSRKPNSGSVSRFNETRGPSVNDSIRWRQSLDGECLYHGWLLWKIDGGIHIGRNGKQAHGNMGIALAGGSEVNVLNGWRITFRLPPYFLV